MQAGLGLIGSGSMYPDILREHIKKCKAATDKPFGVNLPLIYPQMDEIAEIVIEEGVKIVFTSAGNPKKWTEHFQRTRDQGCPCDRQCEICKKMRRSRS